MFLLETNSQALSLYSFLFASQFEFEYNMQIENTGSPERLYP